MSAVGGLMSLTNMPLRNIIGFSYRLSAGQTHYLMPGLPNWVESERFDIEARAGGNPSKDEFRLMVQSLLADRFKLTVHRETRQLRIFAMVLSKPGKTGPQLTPHTDDAMCVADEHSDLLLTPNQGLPPFPCGSIIFPGLRPRCLRSNQGGGGRNLTLDYIAAFLTEFQGLDRPVVNRTGLSGNFDFWMELTPVANSSRPSDTQPDPTGPTVFEALKDQLGLKLESTTGPVDVLAIDHIEEPSPN